MKAQTISKTLLAVILFGVIIPPLIGWGVFLKTPGIAPEAARRQLEDPRNRAVLLDVRSASEFRDYRLPKAVNVPLEKILADPHGLWAGPLKAHAPVLVLCHSGMRSMVAVDRLKTLGVADVRNVTGGMDGWLVQNSLESPGASVRVVTPVGETEGVPRVGYSLFEQFIICAAAFGIKPLYELISLILVILLWRETAPDLTALRRSMIAFFLGENACAVNYLFYNDQSLLMEYFHMYGMLVCFGFAGYALMKTVDIRMIKFSGPKSKCALLPLCNACYKYKAVSCNIRLVFLFIILAMALVCLMPITAQINSRFFIAEIFGNDAVFGHPAAYQFLELRIWPWLALFFFSASFCVLFFQKEKGFDASKMLFCAGLGAIGFSLMRFLIYSGYAKNPLWADAWEEITEFLFVGFAAWIVFRVRSADRGRL